MNYSCQLCNYSSFIKCNYAKHMLSKRHKNNIILESENIDTLKNLFICQKCNKQFSTKQWYNHHLSRCRGVSSNLECSKCNKIFNISSSRYKHEKKCSTFPLIHYDAPDNKIINITNNVVNNITNNINNGVNIIVNNFGNENFDYFMEHPNFITFMNNCIENKIDGICNLIVKKHFDPEHKENHNIS